MKNKRGQKSTGYPVLLLCLHGWPVRFRQQALGQRRPGWRIKATRP
nr:MAG TPA: epoxide hydrolase [Caudoviricetes sp.]